MAAGPETNLWNSMKRNMPEGCSATRLENRHGGGLPDLLLMWESLFYFVELKAPKSKLKQELTDPAAVSSEDTDPPVFYGASILRPEQRAYHARAASRGCPTFILARPQKSNKINLLVPVLRLDDLVLREVCSTARWPEVFEALRLETVDSLRKALICHGYS